MNKEQTAHKFAIPGILAIDETEHGLTRATITSGACMAEIYLQGAHITKWQPVGHKPVLFLSERSDFLPGKAIRGGVPIIFPWFGARTTTINCSRTDGPSHGFARTSDWQLASATVDGYDLHLRLTLAPNDKSRSLGWDDFWLTYELTIGQALRLQLTVENRSETPMVFEEALHSYFMVGDAQQARISGLANTVYFDKTDGFKRKFQEAPYLVFTGETDRPYLNTEAAVDLEDPAYKRRITIAKLGSKTTVVWNPWSEVTANIADMSTDGWRRMTCIETANAAENAVTLAPGGQHTMQATISVNEFELHTLLPVCE
jgi:glucose-6-phosphate 1-epimerase